MSELTSKNTGLFILYVCFITVQECNGLVYFCQSTFSCYDIVWSFPVSLLLYMQRYVL